MTHGPANIGQICPNLAFPKEAKEEKPAPIKAPVHTPPKVIGDPSREPINKQAALIIAPVSWIYKPMPPEIPPVSDVERLKAENATFKNQLEHVKTENAALIRRNESLFFRLREAHKKIAALTGQVAPPEAIEPSTTPIPSRKLELLERLRNGENH